jgi:regulator of protease activity HflC (stomatin/prohibitin superfamily)
VAITRSRHRRDIIVPSGGTMIQERQGRAVPGYPVLFGVVVGVVALVIAIAYDLANGGPPAPVAPGAFRVAIVLVALAVVLGSTGLTVIDPNEARVLVRLGRYAGSIKQQGLWWVDPLTRRRRISIKIRNFESQRLKVNDHDGNPIEIAAVVVWRVVDTAEALFEVDDYEQFLRVQTEAAIRTMATAYPYDGHGDELSLRGDPHEIGEELKREVQSRLEQAGIEVLDTRISHLAYAPEIAGAMLRRQQANAIVDARTRIVGGAVSMVQMALEQLSSQQIVELDEERKAAMVSNLLVVLCSERESQPVVNAGSLY